jgi:hypothetical protein
MNDDAVHQLNRGDAIASKLCSYRIGVSVSAAVAAHTGFDGRNLRRRTARRLKQHQVFSRDTNADL